MDTPAQDEPKDRHQFRRRHTGSHFPHNECSGAEDGYTSGSEDREQRREMSVIFQIRIDVRVERVVRMGSIKRHSGFGRRHLQLVTMGRAQRTCGKRGSSFGGG
jgi:hypothetical protein